ncbi:CPBP family intramembrane glutamic endopeptidase [Rhodococcoides fascians]|uniref:CPBP family intramembrane glutamic endopeptidase n=1 Tax=Rhodococcoides fascians TaxID=1828 RepID=UPI00050BFE63|nr:CPBP family intramembrane glutamic endopeptidase [Rhodococcus fascians]
MVADKSTDAAPPIAPTTPSPVRLIASVILGAGIIFAIYGGPAVDTIAGIDLRFGLTGPQSGDPWKWAGSAALIAVVMLVERRGLSSLLIRRPSSGDIEWVMYAFGAVMVWSWLLSIVAPQTDNDGVATIAALGLGGVLILIVTAAVTEEIVYRGYLAERLGALLGRGAYPRLAGAAASLSVFVVPHVAFFGPSWLLHQLPGTLALAAIALFRRNLPAAMLLHFLINAPILIPTITNG